MTSEPEHSGHPLNRLIAAARGAARVARMTANRLQHATERRLHPLRRQRAAARLPAGISEVLVVCYGNICRSPYAAAALSREPGSGSRTIRSAGFFGPDRRSPDAALTVASQRGLALDHHRSSLITSQLAESADLIVAMEQQHVRELLSRFRVQRRRIVLLGDFDPQPISTRAVPDPYGGDLGVFHACYERIERCARALASGIGERGQDAGQIQPRAR
jgi:protein-tyrosine-phosphatase